MNTPCTNSSYGNQVASGEIHLILVFFLTLSMISFLVISPAHAYAQTSAPTISYSCNPRCWGTNYWPGTVNGAYTFLAWASGARFYYGNGFVQNTMWLLDETEPNNCKPLPSDLPGDCYVEAGLRAYQSGGVNVTALFWADVRPGYNFAIHFGPVINTTGADYAINIQIWKAGTVPGYSWCPVAGSEWCVSLYTQPNGEQVNGISGSGHTNTMKVSGYREGMELEGSSGAYANPMYFDYNQYQSVSNNSYIYQSNPGNYSKYYDNPPVDSYWVSVPAGSSNYGGTWETCITGAGC